MTTTPSYLKGLAETRARSAGELGRLSSLIQQADEQVTALEQELHRTLEIRKAFWDRLKTTQKELDSCDTLIRKFDSRLEPTLIKPIKAWKGRYGKRGTLNNTLFEYMAAQAPCSVSTAELLLIVQAKFGEGVFADQPKHLWVANSLRPHLRALAKKGLIERVFEPGTRSNASGRWRSLSTEPMTIAELRANAAADRPHSKTDVAPSLDHLRAQAEAQGVAVQPCGDAPA